MRPFIVARGERSSSHRRGIARADRRLARRTGGGAGGAAGRGQDDARSARAARRSARRGDRAGAAAHRGARSGEASDARGDHGRIPDPLRQVRTAAGAALVRDRRDPRAAAARRPGAARCGSDRARRIPRAPSARRSRAGAGAAAVAARQAGGDVGHAGDHGFGATTGRAGFPSRSSIWKSRTPVRWGSKSQPRCGS